MVNGIQLLLEVVFMGLNCSQEVVIELGLASFLPEGGGRLLRHRLECSPLVAALVLQLRPDGPGASCILPGGSLDVIELN